MFLPKVTSFVKVFNLLLVLLTVEAYAKSETYTLSKGQVFEISSVGLKNYVIGNKEVLSVKHDKNKQKLLIKAKMTGYSQLRLWGKKMSSLHFYVLSKQNQLKLLEIKEILNKNGLVKNQIIGNQIWVEGEIDTFKDYKIFKTLEYVQKEQIKSYIKINKELQKEILGKVYREFFNNYYDGVKCEISYTDIRCLTSDEAIKDSDFVERVKSKYHVMISKGNEYSNLDNYDLEMRIFQIENLNGREVNFGLDQLRVNLSEIITLGPQAIYKNNTLALNKHKIDVSTLATPKAVLRAGTPLELKVGSEIPYISMNTASNLTTTKWKFAGLNVNLTMTKSGPNFVVKYSTKLTRPISTGKDVLISGNSQKSEVVLVNGSALKLFEIDLKTDDIQSKSIPGLSEIPILKHLFNSKSNSQTYKKIIAIIKVTKRNKL